MRAAPEAVNARGGGQQGVGAILGAMAPCDTLLPDPVIEAYKKDVDRSLLQRNLLLTVEQRFLQLMELQRFAEELQKAGRRLRATPP
jgi:hypothetical protein